MALLLAGWLLYDGLCRLDLGNTAFSVLGTALPLGLCWGVSHLYTGRGAYMQIAMLGTIMAANVFFIIIPSQKQNGRGQAQGRAAGRTPGARAKQRSVHNNYLTLPVVFTMLSTHFAFTYAHAYNWLVLFVIFGAGMLVRHYFNLRNRGPECRRAAHRGALVIGVVLAWAIAPRKPVAAPTATASASLMKCTGSSRHVASPATRHDPRIRRRQVPAGVMFDTPRHPGARSANLRARSRDQNHAARESDGNDR